MIVEHTHDRVSCKNQLYIITETAEIEQIAASKEEKNYIQKKISEDEKFIAINRLGNMLFVVIIDAKEENYRQNEQCRKKGCELAAAMKKERITEIDIFAENREQILAFAEGFELGKYSFTKYCTPNKEKPEFTPTISLVCNSLNSSDIQKLKTLIEAVTQARNLVNEPVLYLNATQLAEQFTKMGNESGFTSKIYYRQEIEAMRMGGLLAVNRGSIDQPTLSVLEWKPKNAANSQPIVLVGKGVVFDTGGLSLKPTPDSMDSMKCDMAGGATVAATIYWAAKTKLPLHIIAIVPATDNRPGGNAITPGDIITMHNGTTVEILNTDAEGRLLLADALSYAKQFNPKLVIDVATLTGSAVMALSIYGIAAMGKAAETVFDSLKKSGNEVYERIVEFPLWEEYDEMIKSDIADVKNIGGREAGLITAGKFLERFISYPWVHLDIAGPAFLDAAEHYQPKGGTGIGVRLLVRFLEKQINSEN